MIKPNLEVMAKAICMGTALLVLGVLSMNPFTLLYSIFLLISVRSVLQTWKDWRIIMFIFYILALVVGIIWVAGIAIYLIDLIIGKDEYTRKDYYWIFACVIIDVISAIALWLVVNSHTQFNSIYVGPDGAAIPSSLIGEQLIVSEPQNP